MALLDINFLGSYGKGATLLQLFYGFLFIAALLELCRVEFLTVVTWASMISAWFGVHVLLNWGLLHDRIMSDYTRGGAAVPHRYAFYHHAMIVIIVGTVLTTIAWIVHTSHNKSNLAVFNDRRYASGTIPAGLLDIYIQWQSLMTLVIVGFIATLTTYSAFIQRIFDPILRALDEVTTPLQAAY